MPVDQHGGPGHQPGIHAHAVIRPKLDSHKPLPIITPATDIRAQLTKETALELMNLGHIHAHNQALVSCGAAIDDKDVFKLVVTGWGDGCPLIYFSGIEQVQNRKTLCAEHAVHALETETALTIEEI